MREIGKMKQPVKEKRNKKEKEKRKTHKNPLKR